jgi:hypothetical protein
MTEQHKRWLKWVGWGLLLLVCISPCISCSVNQLPFMRRYYANRLDYVLGQVEPVLLAGDGVSGVDLSPDGKWLFVNISVANDIPRPGMMNMETYQIYPLDIPQGGGPVWIDNHHYKLGLGIIRVPDMASWRLEQRDTDVDSLDILGEAKHIFAIEKLTGWGSQLISTDPNFPYAVSVSWTGDELTANLSGIPHIILPQRVWEHSSLFYNHRIYSPDGQYFVSGVGGIYSPGDEITQPGGSRQPLAIFDAHTEKGVALAQKNGWSARLLGWASDSSGIYLEFGPKGAGYGGQPIGLPVYKLLVPGQEPSGKKPIVVEGTPPSP